MKFYLSLITLGRKLTVTTMSFDKAVLRKYLTIRTQTVQLCILAKVVIHFLLIKVLLPTEKCWYGIFDSEVPRKA